MQPLRLEVYLIETNDFQADVFQELCSCFVETTKRAAPSPPWPFSVGDEMVSSQLTPGIAEPQRREWILLHKGCLLPTLLAAHPNPCPHTARLPVRTLLWLQYEEGSPWV